ncbi:hypothetical protein FRB94_003311 [Tulasnella sp. JGI-2019a]|nr:hypothetical protein FRB93_014062 [Tulasnella sp. JGI-2019a]KAG9003199.1 hypothetical protein FRB94_003311 [Tulasnella sp. JGI-2019a]
MGNSNSTYNPTTDIPDLKGKVIIVTGANVGIGYETVAELVKHGAKVYMGARNESRATGAIAKLQAQGYLDGPNAGEVVWLKLDLATPEAAKSSAQEFLRRETRLDVLVNNAGIGQLIEGAFNPVKDVKISVGTLMATNHLGPFVFTNTLMPLIRETAAELNSDVRVVTVASSAHSQSPNIDWKSTDGWNFKSSGFFADLGSYGATKLANILFAKQLQRIFDDENVNAISISLHPGGVDTDFAQKMPASSWLGYVLFHLTRLSGQLLTPAQGAYTTLFAATSPGVQDRKKYGGAYLVPYGGIAEPTAAAKDPVAARDLWVTSESLVAAMY